jgi:predicted Rdx family selenoprotein
VEAEVRKEYGDIDVRLIPGRGGVFDVIFDGKLIYSKHDTTEQRFPKVGEVSSLIRKEIG